MAIKTKKSKKRPIICLPCNIIDLAGLPAHVVRDTYIRAIEEVIGGVPLLIPALGKHFDFADIAKRVDGIMLTGSPSHVSPSCYGEERVFGEEELDLKRDATTLPMIKVAIKMNKPILAICRGFQELNVVMGGTLHQRVHELPGKNDHRARKGMPLKDIYEMKSHDVLLEKGGMLEKMGLPKKFKVNTLHQQGINRLGKGLRVEALSDDGVIEAISILGKKFIVGTQWHPEGDWYLNKPSRQILAAFGDAMAA